MTDDHSLHAEIANLKNAVEHLRNDFSQFRMRELDSAHAEADRALVLAQQVAALAATQAALEQRRLWAIIAASAATIVSLVVYIYTGRGAP